MFGLGVPLACCPLPPHRSILPSAAAGYEYTDVWAPLFQPWHWTILPVRKNIFSTVLDWATLGLAGRAAHAIHNLGPAVGSSATIQDDKAEHGIKKAWNLVCCNKVKHLGLWGKAA